MIFYRHLNVITHSFANENHSLVHEKLVINLSTYTMKKDFISIFVRNCFDESVY